MKAALVLTSLLFSSITSASYENWTLTTRSHVVANTPREVKQLQILYPEYLKDIRNVEKATIYFSTWTYDGQSSCEEGDPRLEWKDVYVSKCVRTGGRVACSLDMPPFPPIDEDPCKEHDF